MSTQSQSESTTTQANDLQQTYTNILIPQDYEVQSIDDKNIKVVLEPFERGFGHTLGFALRRILLSSMLGFAITKVKIDGITHQYDTIAGIQEDVLEILMNIKSVALKSTQSESINISLEVTGPKVVTAADFIVEGNKAEIINPDHVICHINTDKTFRMTLKVVKDILMQTNWQIEIALMANKSVHFISTRVLAQLTELSITWKMHVLKIEQI